MYRTHTVVYIYIVYNSAARALHVILVLAFEGNSPNAAARWGARGTADGLLLPTIDLGLNNLEITAEAAIVPLDYRGILHVIFQ